MPLLESLETAKPVCPPLAEVPNARPAPSLNVADKPLRARPTLVAAMAIGILGQWLLGGQASGISFPIFTSATLAAFFLAGGREWRLTVYRQAWILVLAESFSAMVFFRETPALTALNMGAAFALLALFIELQGGPGLGAMKLFDFPLAVARTAGYSLFRPPAVIADSVDGQALRRVASEARPWIRGALVALPVLALFTALLASADAVFSHLLDWMFAGRPDGDVLLRRVAVASIVSFVSAGLIAQALRRKPVDPGVSEARRRGTGPGRLGFIEASMLVGSVDLLFLVFGVIQFGYLFGGEARIRSTSVSYSEYAQRGFWELLAVSVLSLVLILVACHWVQTEGSRRRAIFSLGCSAMVALVMVLLASALRRMSLYEQVYGYTRLRLYSHVYIFVLAGLHAWRAITLWWRPRAFALGAFASCVVFLAGMNAVNPDAFIARKNLERAQTCRMAVDTDYLTSLSSDAAPVVEAYAPYLSPADAEKLGRWLDETRQERASLPWQSRRFVDLTWARSPGP